MGRVIDPSWHDPRCLQNTRELANPVMGTNTTVERHRPSAERVRTFSRHGKGERARASKGERQSTKNAAIARWERKSEFNSTFLRVMDRLADIDFDRIAWRIKQAGFGPDDLAKEWVRRAALSRNDLKRLDFAARKAFAPFRCPEEWWARRP